MQKTINAIEEIYTKGVKSIDKKGFADKFKMAMKTFEKALKEDIKVTFKDVKYLDGYFIFGTGTNSVVHFKLKETPDWLYGIWWNIPKKYYAKEKRKMVLPKFVEGHFFAQYEKNIDKFKPSASTIQCEFSIVPNDNHCSLYEVAKNIEFIIKEPYLAFCRDYCYNDYNHEYLSRNKAKRIYKKWCKEENNYIKWNKILNDRFIKFVKNMLKEEIESDNAFIVDMGENCSPRYEIFVKSSYYPNLTIEKGCCFCLFDEEDAESIKAKAKWDKEIKKCEKISNKHGSYWFRPFDDSFNLIEDKNYNKLKKYSV